jgi:hypothetical protein
MEGKHGIYSQGCQHPADMLQSSKFGGMKFYGGDLFDTVEEHIYCRACGRDVTREIERRERSVEVVNEI